MANLLKDIEALEISERLDVERMKYRVPSDAEVTLTSKGYECKEFGMETGVLSNVTVSTPHEAVKVIESWT